MMLALSMLAYLVNRPLQQRFLALFTIPDVAVIALAVGILLIYLEFNVPGRVVPGAIGTLCITLALYGLIHSQISGSATSLVITGIILLLLEARFHVYGVLGVIGAVAIVFGLYHLASAPVSGEHVHAVTAILIGATFSVATFTLSSIAIRARRNKAIPGPWQ